MFWMKYIADEKIRFVWSDPVTPALRSPMKAMKAKTPQKKSGPKKTKSGAASSKRPPADSCDIFAVDDNPPEQPTRRGNKHSKDLRY